MREMTSSRDHKMAVSRKKRKVAVVLGALLVLRRMRKRTLRWENRKTWVKPWIQRRQTHGIFNNLLRELAEEDAGGYKAYMRMTPDNFNEILTMVGPLITKQNTKLRESISPHQRLAITLRFLATGESYHSLNFSYRVGRSTVSNIVDETCSALYESLKDTYIKMPNTEERWKEIATGFERKWNYAFCLGALDGKHVRMKNPQNSGSCYFNYKNFYSVILMALVDADYKFIYVSVGAPGRNGDAGVYGESTLKAAIDRELLNIPNPGNLRGTNDLCHYHIVGDDAFPLGKHMMKPYPHRNLSRDVVLFNYRFSRARRVVENAFGILAARFRVFQSQIELEPAKVSGLLLASCCLHNFLVEKQAHLYISNLVDNDGEFDAHSTVTLTELQKSRNRNATVSAKNQRDSLKKYFLSAEGSVPWQNKIVNNKIQEINV